MKVIDTIQALQEVIDQLSYHKADTEVSIQTNGDRLLTNVIEVDDKNGKVVVTIHERVADTIDDFYDGYLYSHYLD
jgi:hypothetical protein